VDIQDVWRRKYRIPLETPRLLLRPFVDEDEGWLAGLHLDPEVTRYLWEGADTEVKARRAAGVLVQLDQQMCQLGHWAILDRESGQAHGWTELTKLRPWDGPSDEIALSYVLRRASWGRGIATEAAGRLLQYAFEVHQLERVMAVTMAGHEASQRVLEKLGMCFVKTLKSRSGPVLRYFRIDNPSADTIAR